MLRSSSSRGRLGATRLAVGLVTTLLAACASPTDDAVGDAEHAQSKKSGSVDVQMPPAPAPRDDWEIAREWAREAPNVSAARYPGDATACRGYRNGDGALGTGLFAPVQFAGAGATQLEALTSAFVQCKRMVFNQAPNDEYNQRMLCLTRHALHCRNE